MKKLIIIAIAVLIFGCTNQERGPVSIVENDTKPVENKVNAGWNDNDTYTVRVSASNIDKAKDKARSRILKDIINSRMRKQSRYTDISKISYEFDALFDKGVVIKEKEIQGGIEIYYQIREKGLKFKFERK